MSRKREPLCEQTVRAVIDQLESQKDTCRVLKHSDKDCKRSPGCQIEMEHCITHAKRGLNHIDKKYGGSAQRSKWALANLLDSATYFVRGQEEAYRTSRRLEKKNK